MSMQSEHPTMQSTGNPSPDSERSSPFEPSDYVRQSPSDPCSSNISASNSASRTPSASASEASSTITSATTIESSTAADNEHQDADNDITPTSPASDDTPAQVEICRDSLPPVTEAERLAAFQAVHDRFYSDDAGARERRAEWDRAVCGETEGMSGVERRGHDEFENGDKDSRQEPTHSS